MLLPFNQAFVPHLLPDIMSHPLVLPIRPYVHLAHIHNSKRQNVLLVSQDMRVIMVYNPRVVQEAILPVGNLSVYLAVKEVYLLQRLHSVQLVSRGHMQIPFQRHV